MTLIQKIDDALSAIFNEAQKDVIHHVEVLDKNNQCLATGSAILDTPEVVGVFDPNPPLNETIPAEFAATLKKPDGKIFYLSSFQKCSASTHYHFRTKKD